MSSAGSFEASAKAEIGTVKQDMPKDGPYKIVRSLQTAFVPDDTTYDSIRIILNEQDPKEKDLLTEQWRTHKLEELNFIGIVGALLASCLTSTGDWPNVLGNGQTQPWTVKTCWYAGIVCALFAVLTVAQQSMRLHRLCAHRDGLQRIRSCMTHPDLDRNGCYRPRRWRVYTWQVGPILLAASVLCMVVGMGIMLWVGATEGPLKKEYEQWWDANAKMAVTWTIALVAVVLSYLASQFGLAET